MAINRLRLTAPLTRGNVPEEHAAEFTDALVNEVEREIEPLVARSEMEEAINRAVAPLLQVIGDLRKEVGDLRKEVVGLREDLLHLRVEVADRQTQQEHRTTTLFIAAVAITIAAVGVGTGVTIAVLT